MDSDDDFITQIEVKCDGRNMQLRRDQLTVPNLAKLSHVLPDTLYLISDDGYVALPDSQGQFSAVECFRVWRVEGVKSSKGAMPSFGTQLYAASSSTQATSSGYGTRAG